MDAEARMERIKEIIEHEKHSRPLGVTIISIIGLVGSLLIIFGSLFFIFIGTFIISFLGFIGNFLDKLIGLSLIMIIPLIFGIIEFIGFYKLFKMKKIGYYIVIIILIICLIMGIIPIVLIRGMILSFNLVFLGPIISIIIDLIIIIYLYKKREMFS